MKNVLASIISVDDTGSSLNREAAWVNAYVPLDVSEHIDQEVYSSVSMSDIPSTDAWYILYWLDQYNTLPEVVKEKIRIDPNRSKFFGEFSDSIGALLSVEYVKDNSTVPVSDIASNITGYTYSSVLDYIVTPDSHELHNEMSIKVNNIFKYNMTFIKDDTGVPSKLSTDSHGRNLITDSQHYVRLLGASEKLENLMKSKLGGMYDVLQFIRSNISETRFHSWKTQLLVEQEMSSVDMFGSRAIYSTSESLSGSLRSQSLPIE